MQQPIFKQPQGTTQWGNWLNAIPNVLWSLLLITPVYIFCYRYMRLPWVYGFGVASLVPYVLPVSMLRFFELSPQRATYRHLRVHLVNRVTQHGGLIQGFVRHRSPPFLRLPGPAALAHLERVTYGRERFHMALFLFFLLTALYAAAERRLGWALLLLPVNVIYNLYPIWLQQYVRLRLNVVRDRR